MKVGDLVREIGYRRDLCDVGVIIECQGDRGATWGVYWRVLFGSELNYVREADLEVISESR